MLLVSPSGNRISKKTEFGKLSFDMRNHNIYLSNYKIGKFEEGELVYFSNIDTAKEVDHSSLEDITREMVKEIIET